MPDDHYYHTQLIIPINTAGEGSDHFAPRVLHWLYFLDGSLPIIAGIFKVPIYVKEKHLNHSIPLVQKPLETYQLLWL